MSAVGLAGRAGPGGAPMGGRRCGPAGEAGNGMPFAGMPPESSPGVKRLEETEPSLATRALPSPTAGRWPAADVLR